MRNTAHISLFSFLLALGCMDPAYDFSQCKKIEIARCQLRKDCESHNPKDFDKRFPDFDYNTCVTYAKEHCKTREIGHPDSTWNDEDVAGCTAAIAALHPGSCDELQRAIDETDAENGLIKYVAVDDAGQISDAGADGPCWFINRIPEEEENKDDNTDNASDNAENKD